MKHSLDIKDDETRDCASVAYAAPDEDAEPEENLCMKEPTTSPQNSCCQTWALQCARGLDAGCKFSIESLLCDFLLPLPESTFQSLWNFSAVITSVIFLVLLSFSFLMRSIVFVNFLLSEMSPAPVTRRRQSSDDLGKLSTILFARIRVCSIPSLLK